MVTNNPKYYSDNIQRFDLISEWVLSFIKSDTMVFIEGYSFRFKRSRSISNSRELWYFKT